MITADNDHEYMNLLFKLSVPVTLLTYLSVRYVDRPVSLFIHDHLYSNRHWSRLTASLPDTLFFLVVIISVSAYIGYCYRKKKLLLDANTRLLRHIALSLPVAYGVKAILKLICGRVQTRFWLHNPLHYEFHWFQAGPGFNGFPSGHMIVFTTLFVALGRYCGAYRIPCFLLVMVLAFLLVATNYHFVGDVIFGTYIGFLIEGCLDRACPDRDW